MRRRRAEQRILSPDVKYGSVEVARFINKVMQRGKKTVAQGIVYDALGDLEGRANRPALEVFQDALRNATPLLQVKPRRVGGATYQVPLEVPPDRGRQLATRWLITGARSRKGRPMREKLAQELLDASKGEGSAVKRLSLIHI